MCDKFHLIMPRCTRDTCKSCLVATRVFDWNIRRFGWNTLWFTDPTATSSGATDVFSSRSLFMRMWNGVSEIQILVFSMSEFDEFYERVVKISKFFIIISVLLNEMCWRYRMFAWDRDKHHHSSSRYLLDIVFCIFVFVACVFLSSCFLDKSQVLHNVSLHIFHLPLSSRD